MSDFSPTEKPRALSLDALRGLAILLMVFSGRIPFGVLPDWMYHAQVPPPDHVFRADLPGITWVDLVFPFFLFSMGAAMPLALIPRLRSGLAPWRIVAGILRRGMLLAAFAIYVMHIRPWLLDKEPSAGDYALCLLGFALLFPMFVRLPGSWTLLRRAIVRCGGWTGAAVLMAVIRFQDGSGFSLYRSDIIILVLSNVAVAGALVWLATRQNLLLRFGLLAILLALRLSHLSGGWAGWLWDATPAPWLYRMLFLNYLFVVIPGTVVGDMLVTWMDSRESQTTWSKSSLAALAVLPVVLNVVLVVGLKNRWVVETSLAALLLCALSVQLVRHPASAVEHLIRGIIRWGGFCLVLGLALEPFEGGIKKDHSTLSYYFVTVGLAMHLLVTFIVLVDILKHERPFRLLIRSGQNPLVAYAGVNSLVPPVLGLAGLDRLIEAITPTPWLGVLRGAFQTYLVALAAAAASRWRLFLKT